MDGSTRPDTTVAGLQASLSARSISTFILAALLATGGLVILLGTALSSGLIGWRSRPEG